MPTKNKVTDARCASWWYSGNSDKVRSKQTHFQYCICWLQLQS